MTDIAFESLEPIAQVFCLALADDRELQRASLPDAVARVDLEALDTFVRREACESILSVAFANAGLVEPEAWRDSAAKVRERLRLYMGELDRVSSDFGRHGIRIVALKNSGIARGLYPDLAGCPMGDIDALVAPGDFRRAHERMLALGYEWGDRSPFALVDLEDAESHGGAEYAYTLSNGETLWFELQWRPVAGRWIRPDQEPPADRLVSRSVAIPGTDVRMLAPEDNLMQVCLHTAKHSFVRAPGFRLLTDVDRIVRRSPIDWTHFVNQTNLLEVRTAVYLALHLSAEFLRTPIPNSVLLALDFSPRKHRTMERWLIRVGLFDPNRRKWSKIGYILFNLMLYDTVGGVWRAVLPDNETMTKRYDIRSKWALPYWHTRRVVELLCKRFKT